MGAVSGLVGGLLGGGDEEAPAQAQGYQAPKGVDTASGDGYGGQRTDVTASAVKDLQSGKGQDQGGGYNDSWQSMMSKGGGGPAPSAGYSGYQAPQFTSTSGGSGYQTSLPSAADRYKSRY